jgi:glycerol-3-phosphate acyltransferase PlsY
MDYLIVGIASYLMGSIPFGLILTKVFLNKDIRDIGSGNIGATNALRTGNKLIGYSTLVLDIAKAIIPVIFVKINYPDLIYIASLCAFLGHVFPVWLKFKGGKGCCYLCWNFIFYKLFTRNYFCSKLGDYIFNV